MKIFSLDGNIGSGKSTLLNMLKNYYQGYDIIFLTEPVDVWRSIKDKNGEDILTKFYKDTKKHSFEFQIMAYISRLSKLRKAIRDNPNAIIVTERSVYTDRYVFAKMLYDSGNIDDTSYEIYTKLFEEFTKEYKIDGYIYVKTNPMMCFNRIDKRNRKGELVPIDYLINCEKYHEEWLSNQDNVLVLDGNVEFETRNDSFSQMTHNIDRLINTTVAQVVS